MVEVRAAIEDSNSRFSAAVRSQDVDQVGAFYCDDGVLTVAGSPPARGREEITTWFAHAFAAGLTELTFETAEIRAFSELAIEEGEYRMVSAGTQRRGRYLLIHQRNANGAWQALYDVVQPG